MMMETFEKMKLKGKIDAKELSKIGGGVEMNNSSSFN
jgi:hypothetical protein